VNGVLGAVYKEIGEPGKDQVSRPKTPRAMLPDEPIDITKLPVEAKAGAIIFCEHDGQKLMVLAHDVFGYWTILKGGAEEGETAEQTAIREIKEKIDLDTEIVETLGSIEYVASHPEKGKLLKKVTYFLAKGEYKELEMKNSGGLDKAAWFPLNEIVDLTIYDDIVPLIAKAVEIISK
jgi:8-oxo-dGTP pyrophosphatase MutT (NUDIX family)